jgi:hypothetical protein
VVVREVHQVDRLEALLQGSSSLSPMPIAAPDHCRAAKVRRRPLDDQNDGAVLRRC